jgi:diguanylate cyclase (GGDEF)-like protein
VLRDFLEYQVESELHQGQTSIVYRARRTSDNAPVILKALRSEFPAQAVVARYGGEEFALLLPSASASTAMLLAEQARMRVLALAIPHERAQAASFVTLSIGVAERKAGEAIAETIKRADFALYQAKHAGRNRVVSAP